ncbi:MAG: proton-conducting transporter transmembrane domain-containing protein [Lacisediminihabitans sp.]
MTGVTAGLLAQLVLAFSAVALAFSVPARVRSTVSGIFCGLISTAGAITGALVLVGAQGSLTIPLALPVDPLTLAPDRLGGLFMLVASAVGILVSVYGIRYAHGPSASRTSWAALALFLVGMQLVPAAADSVSFLLMWETMALGSTILLLAEHKHRSQVGSAAVWYSAMSQLSFLLLLGGFTVLSGAVGSTSFSAMRAVASHSWPADLAFMLLVLGFGSKAGLVPLHVWLPRAHPEAPSHISAAMSAAMVKMGVYGALLVCVRLLPAGPSWWGVVLLILGGVSAVYGILQASVASDVKKLLAYSTTENVGLIFLAIGASVLLRSYAAAAAADVALVAALLLVVSHAAFKVTLFLGAGSMLHATGERNLDRLGGLGRRMPWTGAAFGIASLGAAALPITSGFVAEWMLLQSLIHGARLNGRLVSLPVSIAMPLAVAVIALTAGLALLTFVKAYGIGFLARPRSAAATAAHEVPVLMRVAPVTGAIGILALGLFPGPVAVAVASAVGPDVAKEVRSIGLAGVGLPGIGALLDPVGLLASAAIVAIPILMVIVATAKRHPQRVSKLVWGGGGDRTSPRMQYTATSYAEPLSRVFDDVLQPTRDVQVTHLDESRYLVRRIQVEQRVSDLVETWFYRPVLRFADHVGVLARGLQNGSIHRYLGYSFGALLIVLVAVSL